MTATQLPGLPVVDSSAAPASSVVTVPSGTSRAVLGAVRRRLVPRGELGARRVQLKLAGVAGGSPAGDRRRVVSTCTPIAAAARMTTAAAPAYASFTFGGIDAVGLPGRAECLLRTAIEESDPLLARKRIAR